MAQRRYDHDQWARQQAREDQRQQRAELAAEKASERERKQAAVAAVAAGKAKADQLNDAAGRELARLTAILQVSTIMKFPQCEGLAIT